MPSISEGQCVASPHKEIEVPSFVSLLDPHLRRIGLRRVNQGEGAQCEAPRTRPKSISGERGSDRGSRASLETNIHQSPQDLLASQRLMTARASICGDRAKLSF